MRDTPLPIPNSEITFEYVGGRLFSVCDAVLSKIYAFDIYNAFKLNKIAGQILLGVFVIYLIVVSLGIAHVVFAGDLGAQSRLFW